MTYKVVNKHSSFYGCQDVPETLFVGSLEDCKIAKSIVIRRLWDMSKINDIVIVEIESTYISLEDMKKDYLKDK